ncbi:MAG: hypothetical protein OEU68_10565 [Nitrospira sp.]|jgi:hypothetical protein|nr:hypothetical protein [Nitrospira sp.]MDH4244149.1 hypothetical protein [Nitrospira sp.]MDH4356168.1 hypothetical protein [Nitrospira sp.]
MDVLSKIVEKLPLWSAEVFLAFVGVCSSLSTKLGKVMESDSFTGVKSSSQLAL